MLKQLLKKHTKKYLLLEKQTTLTRPRRGSQTLVESLKHEGDSFVADAVIHRPADLNRWKNWNAFDVSAWLNALNFSLNGVKFFKAGITGDKLASLSTTDLEKMGITKKEEQVAILAKISNLVKGEIA